MSRFHPWRELRAAGHLTLGWHDLAQIDGVLFSDLQTILLRRGLLQVERRCTLAHELAHHRLGHGSCTDRRSARRQEVEAEVVAARWLIDLEAYITARLWSRNDREIAEELWVDVPMLLARAGGLSSDERAYVQSRVSEAQAWGAA